MYNDGDGWSVLPVELMKEGALPRSHRGYELGHGCFGFVNGHLILGNSHHQEILAALLGAGWSWEDLMEAEQIWGWYSAFDGRGIELSFVSDAGFLHDSAEKGAKAAFEKVFKLPVTYTRRGGDVIQRGRGSFGGDFEESYIMGEDPEEMHEQWSELNESQGWSIPQNVTPIPDPPREWLEKPRRQPWMPKDLHPVPTRRVKR